MIILPCVKLSKHINNMERDVIDSDKNKNKNKQLMILLGSGGHTGEMLRILEQWSKQNLLKFEREYIISSGDSTSIMKVKKFEDEYIGGYGYNITNIYRARNVGEGKIKAIFNTFISFQSAIKNLIVKKINKCQPDVFLTNGPGTAIPIAYMIFLMKFFGLCNTKIIYVESLARVNELSLTGILILPISDRIIVQWPQLAKKYRRCEYYGILV